MGCGSGQCTTPLCRMTWIDIWYALGIAIARATKARERAQ